MLWFFFVLCIPFASYSAPLPKLNPNDPLPAHIFTRMSNVINPTVVNISTETRIRQRNFRGQTNDPFFEFFAPFMNQDRVQPRQSLGTGFIIRKDGLILTNAHVVDQADIIKVQLSEKDTTLYEARVIGKDSRTDIALIKIEAKKDLPFAELGTSSDVEVGEWVIAAGNPFGHGHSITKGIISAKGREISELNRFPFLQTDASINPGNSGGPLVNTQGQVIGVNTAIDGRAQGIGFAIPIDDVKKLLPTLESKGFIDRGFLGVMMSDINYEIMAALQLKNDNGVLITEVIKNSPASKAGLKPYDVIIKAGKETITSAADLSRAITDTPIGNSIELRIIREGKERTLSATITAQNKSTTSFSNPFGRNTTQDKGSERSLPQPKSINPSDLGVVVKEMNTEQKNQYMKNLSQEEQLQIQKEGSPPIVSTVQMGSPAARGGLKVGDIILDVNTKSVFKPEDVTRALTTKTTNILRIKRKDTISLIYIRP